MADNLFDKASEALGKGVDAASDIFGKGANAANDLFGKGKDVASGVVSSAGDFGKRGLLRAKLADVNLEYERLMKKLGTVLYEELKNDPKYAETNQALFKEIATCVDRRQGLEDELAELDAASAAEKPIDVQPVAPEGAGEPAAEPEADAAPEQPAEPEPAAAPEPAADDADTPAEDAK